jgi:glycosyltransferase involved in cell wall biosynthesis
MKIALIAPGIMPVPPTGWGAVEILIWDYYNQLRELGHNVVIINKIRSHPSDQANPNTTYCQELIAEINSGGYEFIHLHYDVLYHIIPFLCTPNNNPLLGFTSHYPYIDNPSKHSGDGFSPIFQFMCQGHQQNHQQNHKCINFVLAQKDIDCLIQHGANPENLFKLENGIDPSLFTTLPDVNHPSRNRSIYLGKVSTRKRQYIYAPIAQSCGIDFVGPLDWDSPVLPNYLGCWAREQVHTQLTHYGNLILLSAGEADPLVVKEGLIAGIGIVITESIASVILGTLEGLNQLEGITVIPNNKLDDLLYVEKEIKKNRECSQDARIKLREYAISRFSWPALLNKYIACIQSNI